MKIRILGLANGEETEFAGKYVREYDPHFSTRSTIYDGGLLRVTNDPSKAKAFSSLTEATEYWKQQAPPPYAIRPDGKPNWPLTAFTVEILP